ncbi:MAG: hypothetical protein MI757_11670 [Pirellulales bacterium]|nr:hypothetical protein [Pirellulales bacterium]
MTDTKSFAPIVESLLNLTLYPEKTLRVKLIETHISWVFLTDTHAYKVKKPVEFEFLDFSTMEARREACFDEMALNRRLAPAVYVGVVPIMENARGTLAIDGDRMRVFAGDGAATDRQAACQRQLAFRGAPGSHG